MTGSEMNKLTVANMQVEELRKQLADAQAAIAALQARVQELCKFRQADHEQLVEVQKYWRESQDEVHELQSQLTQRTAELEALKIHCAIVEEHKVIAYKDAANLQAELERVRGEWDEYAHKTKMLCLQNGPLMIENHDMKKLIAALPKVEGEIAVKETEIDLAVMWGITVNGLFGEHSPLFDTKEEADAYAALLQHRQGMEG